MAICKNGIARIRVYAPNGKDSKLFSDILEVYEGDRDQALKTYAYIVSDHYGELNKSNKVDENQEPILSNVLNDISDVFGTLESTKRIAKDTNTKGFKFYGDNKVNKNNIRRARQITSKKKALLKETYKQISVARTEREFKEAYQLSKRASIIKREIENIDSELDAIAMAEIADRDLKSANALLRKTNILSHDLIYIKGVANTWINAIESYFPESPNSTYIMSGEGDSSSEITGFSGFGEIETRADALRRSIERLEKDFINLQLSNETGRKIDIRKEFRNQKDYSSIHPYTMSINRTDNVMFQVVSNINFRLMSDAKEEFFKFEESFDIILKNALSELKKIVKSANPYDIFREKYKDGNQTGNLVRQFNPEYDDAAAIEFKKAVDDGNIEAWKDFYKWFDTNNILLDWRIIFRDRVDSDGDLIYKGKIFDKHDEAKLKASIVELVGEEEYARMYKLAEKNLEEFEMTRELAKDDIYNNPKLATKVEKDKVFENWNKVYSPYYYADVVDNNKPYTQDDIIIRAKGHAYTTVIPRRYHKGSVTETGWYNKDFNNIRNNSAIYKFYNHMLDTLHELNNILPYNVAKGLKDNSIPNLRRSVIDAWFEEGSKGAKKEIMNRLIKSMTAGNSSDLAFAEIDPYTNEIKKNLTINLVKQNNDRINKIYTQKLIAYENKGNKATIEQKRIFKKEATDEVVKDKSFDLGQIIKVYYLTTKMYAKKAQIEDLIRIADNVFKNETEIKRTSDGRAKRNIDGGKIEEKSSADSFTNMKKQWDYWLNYFYGYRTEVEGLSSRKILTEDQKVEKAKIEQLAFELHARFEKGEISVDEYNSDSEKLDRQIVELGGNLSGGKVGRGLLKFVQLKAMGWNAFSGFTNMAFGWIANVTEANDGRVFNKKDLAWATKKVFNSVLKNYSFNLIETEDAKKIRSFINRFDILSETSNEIYQRTYKSSSKTPFAWMKPFNIQNRSEYFNQAPVMLSIMHNTYFNTTKGKIIAYECFNSDGSWNTELGEEPKTEIGKLKTKIAEEIARIHGNYNSENPILANKKLWTTALKQFRTWMFEGAADRFQREMYSEALGITLKGRYKSGFAIFNWAEPKDFKEDELLSFSDVVKNTGFTILQLLRKLTFQNTKFEDKFSEVDAANLRKNLSEFVILMQVAGFIMLLSIAGGDDDDTVAETYVKNYLLNLLFRVQNDIIYYISPSSFEQLTKQSIPAMSLITDATKLVEATIDTAMGKGQITRGIYTGQHKLVRAINRNVPFFNKIQANIGAMKQVYNDITFAK